jgi:hypothetical protein
MKNQKLVLLAATIGLFSPLFNTIAMQSEELSQEEMKKLEFYRLPQELRFENLKFLISGARNINVAIDFIKTSLAVQNLTLSKNQLKEIVRLLWEKYKESDFRIASLLQEKIPSLQNAIASYFDEINFIIYAADNDIYALKKYLKKGVDINVQELNGNTALNAAINNGKFVATEFLLKEGANPNIKNNEGNDALHIAFNDYKRASPEKREKFKIIILLLLEKGADPNSVDKEDVGLLTKAVANFAPDLLKQLLDAGADTENKLREGVIKYAQMWKETLERPAHPGVSAEIQEATNMMLNRINEVINLLKTYWPHGKLVKEFVEPGTYLTVDNQTNENFNITYKILKDRLAQEKSIPITKKQKKSENISAAFRFISVVVFDITNKQAIGKLKINHIESKETTELQVTLFDADYNEIKTVTKRIANKEKEHILMNLIIKSENIQDWDLKITQELE